MSKWTLLANAWSVYLLSSLECWFSSKERSSEIRSSSRSPLFLSETTKETAWMDISCVCASNLLHHCGEFLSKQWLTSSVLGSNVQRLTALKRFGGDVMNVNSLARSLSRESTEKSTILLQTVGFYAPKRTLSLSLSLLVGGNLDKCGESSVWSSTTAIFDCRLSKNYQSLCRKKERKCVW